MSEEDKPSLKGTLEYFKDKKGATIWDINRMMQDKDDDFKELEKVFSPQQLDVLSAIVAKAIAGLDEYHNSKDSDAHPNLQDQISTLEAKFRNHRHKTGKTFSAKPEY